MLFNKYVSRSLKTCSLYPFLLEITNIFLGDYVFWTAEPSGAARVWGQVSLHNQFHLAIWIIFQWIWSSLRQKIPFHCNPNSSSFANASPRYFSREKFFVWVRIKLRREDLHILINQISQIILVLLEDSWSLAESEIKQKMSQKGFSRGQQQPLSKSIRSNPHQEEADSSQVLFYFNSLPWIYICVLRC